MRKTWPLKLPARISWETRPRSSAVSTLVTRPNSTLSGWAKKKIEKFSVETDHVKWQVYKCGRANCGLVRRRHRAIPRVLMTFLSPRCTWRPKLAVRGVQISIPAINAVISIWILFRVFFFCPLFRVLFCPRCSF